MKLYSVIKCAVGKKGNAMFVQRHLNRMKKQKHSSATVAYQTKGPNVRNAVVPL